MLEIRTQREHTPPVVGPIWASVYSVEDGACTAALPNGLICSWSRASHTRLAAAEEMPFAQKAKVDARVAWAFSVMLSKLFTIPDAERVRLCVGDGRRYLGLRVQYGHNVHSSSKLTSSDRIAL